VLFFRYVRQQQLVRKGRAAKAGAVLGKRSDWKVKDMLRQLLLTPRGIEVGVAILIGCRPIAISSPRR
jgi:hypothetical protein